MSPRSVWIERGPDGRPYFVRRKFKTPSALTVSRRSLTAALFPRSARSLLFFRDSRLDQHIQSDSSDRPLALPAPESPMPQPVQGSNPPPMDPTSQAQPQPINMYLLPPQQNPAHPVSRDASAGHILKVSPFPPFFPMPPAGMYAAPPHPAMQYPIPPFPPTAPAPTPFPVQAPLFPAAPPGAIPVHHPPSGPHAPPIRPPVNPSDMRYKCDGCGRFRSARYHYKHPIPPGQLPAKTICRKCREEATDSEGSTSSDSFTPNQRQHRSRGPRPRSSSAHQRKRNISRRRQPRSAGRHGLADTRHYQLDEPFYSDSDSSSSVKDDDLCRARSRRRSRSRHYDVVRYTRRLRLSPREERSSTEMAREQRGQSYNQDSESGDYEYETPKR